ncbi:hypothetical protein Ate02nite_48160 [Paractinoplanes tereljensis]|uniref:Uncharacterized protein n=1 Tax=Paractinoplanes tereljensis TaxID=571912 RepID=A0A919TTU7_9ACTN|nr:hypothetical protein Ate02nite_48160 [Actinoplanes tereljensis]
MALLAEGAVLVARPCENALVGVPNWLGRLPLPAATVASALTGWDKEPTVFQWAMLATVILTIGWSAAGRRSESSTHPRFKKILQGASLEHVLSARQMPLPAYHPARC